jgi:hypothetical protein
MPEREPPYRVQGRPPAGHDQHRLPQPGPNADRIPATLLPLGNDGRPLARRMPYHFPPHEAGWREDDRRQAGWPEDDRRQAGWPEDDRRQAGWPEDDRRQAGWPEDDRRQAGWRENGQNHDGWRPARPWEPTATAVSGTRGEWQPTEDAPADAPGSSRRLTWTSRAILGLILAIQAVLSLRLRNSAFEDEGLYLYAGHAELARLLHAVHDSGDFTAHFSGAPIIYPVLGAAIDSAWGLEGARALSLVFMLGSTLLLYSFTRQLFNERAGIWAAAAFGFSEPTFFVGHLATYDGMDVFLLALTTWIVVRTAQRRWALPLLAAPVAVLAAATKYVGVSFLPTVLVVFFLLARQRWGAWYALLRTFLLGATIAGLIGFMLVITGDLRGIEATTSSRASGTTPVGRILQESAMWTGLPFAVACLGVLMYARRQYPDEGAGLRAARSAWGRLGLGLVLAGSAVLPSLYELRLHIDISLNKHVGFGLLFAAPMAGLAMTRLTGRRFRHVQWPVALSIVMATMGASTSRQLFYDWPNSTQMIAQLRHYVTGSGEYYADTSEVPIYYLGSQTSFADWTNQYYIRYSGCRTDGPLTGITGYQAAIRDGYFKMVVFSELSPTNIDGTILAAMQKHHNYRLVSVIPFATTTWHGQYEIWLRTTPGGCSAAGRRVTRHRRCGACSGGRPGQRRRRATSVAQ